MTVPAPAPLSAGGGGGGLTNESDDIILLDDSTPFLRRVIRDDAGVVDTVADFELDGETPYVVGGTVAPITPPAAATYTDGSPLIVRPTNAGPATVITYNRYVAADSPVVIAANALRVHIVAVADDVTVEGEAVAAGIGFSHGVDGFRTQALDVTIAGDGVALVVEERPA